MDMDTIAAVSTGMTHSGIGKIRISGSDAVGIADRIYRSPSGKKKLTDVPSHTIHYGYIYDQEQMIDEVLVLVMKAPKTYTTEDVVEIDCHGGIVVMGKILETVIKNGARLAEPGEFTKRAFLNGRIDLSQAEAVMDIIRSKNEYALDSSLRQLKGELRKKIENIRKSIIESVAFIEASLDDPEHISMDHYGEELRVKVNGHIRELEQLLDTADSGRMIREGIQTAIVGKPNAGKSSLLNMLSGEERAIVTEVAGTTRDVLEETINIHGITLNIMDTAGIRDTKDVVERIGVDRSKNVLKQADLVIYVIDGSTPLDENDQVIMDMIQDKKAIILLNKSDLEQAVDPEELEKQTDHPVIPISAKYGDGGEKLEDHIKEMFFNGQIDFNDQVYITNIRHKKEVQDALSSLDMVIQSIDDGMPEDFFSIDLMDAYESLGRIIGESVGEDLVDTIFGEFCMGK